MNIRWTAVITGFLIDYFISRLCFFAFGAPDFTIAPNLFGTSHVILLVLGALYTGVGGYVAGRMAGEDQAMHGLLVGAVGVLIGQLEGGSLPRILVIASAIGCLLGAIGGYLSRFPAPRDAKITR